MQTKLAGRSAIVCVIFFQFSHLECVKWRCSEHSYNRLKVDADFVIESPEFTRFVSYVEIPQSPVGIAFRGHQDAFLEQTVVRLAELFRGI